jgi:hypothetical protein
MEVPQQITSSGSERKARTQRRGVAACVGLLTLAIVELSLFSPNMSSDTVRPILPGVEVDEGGTPGRGTFLLDGNYCPEGGNPADSDMVAQDYAYDGSDEPGVLYAIRPELAYVRSGVVALCGSNYGTYNGRLYGEPFQGKALITVGPSTLADRD